MAKKTKHSSNTTSSLSNTASPVSSMEELLAKTGYVIKGLKKGDTVEGIVTKVSPREVLIDIKGKSEGVVIDKELEVYKEMLLGLKVGDTVVAQVIVPENDRGQSVLSLRKFITERRWDILKNAKEAGTFVDVIVRETVRGGVLVEYNGIRGYIPQSQLDPQIEKQLDKLSGRIISVKVVEVDKDTNRLIFSQRAVAEAEAFAKQKPYIQDLEQGTTVEATIISVVPFGAFAKFVVCKDDQEHEIEGLIHVSEIAWEKVEDLHLYVKEGDTVKVKVIGVDKESGKVTLSIKQLLPDPWEDVLDIFQKDSQVKGTVSKVTQIGIFVTLLPGVEGLIHISKIAPGEEPKEGDEIACIVEDVQPEKRKISLSMALTEKPIGYR